MAGYSQRPAAVVDAGHQERPDDHRRFGDFSESETLANIYADYLKALGYTVGKKLKIGTREVYYPALKAGTEVNFIPDYACTLLTFVD